jgi:hypothetical protein
MLGFGAVRVLVAVPHDAHVPRLRVDGCAVDALDSVVAIGSISLVVRASGCSTTAGAISVCARILPTLGSFVYTMEEHYGSIFS